MGRLCYIVDRFNKILAVNHGNDEDVKRYAEGIWGKENVPYSIYAETERGVTPVVLGVGLTLRNPDDTRFYERIYP